MHKDKEYDNDNDIAEAFNNFYGSIAEKTKAKIVNTNTTFDEFMPRPNQNTFFAVPTTAVEIADLIRNLNTNSAVGPRSIRSDILKLISPSVSPMLSQIFNECLIEGIFPDCLKTAQITPVHKKDSLIEIENYRPISLLSNIGKLFEKLLHDRIYKFFEKENLLFNKQFGFRKHHNTSHAIIALTESIRNSLRKKEYSVGVFVDLQKAFDTVEHDILIKKLDTYGLRGTSNNLLKSYLSNRKHNVKIRKSISKSLDLKHGVPQGSVLGPLLFLIYINDLHRAIDHSETYHFADDTCLLNKNTSLKQLNKQTNHDLRRLVDWLRCNKISLNASKTEIILFKGKHEVIEKKLHFKLSGQKLTLKNHVKYLGIYLDEHLDWKKILIFFSRNFLDQ